MKFVESSMSVSSRSEMAGMVVVISEKHRSQVLWNMSISVRTISELKAESKVNKSHWR